MLRKTKPTKTDEPDAQDTPGEPQTSVAHERARALDAAGRERPTGGGSYLRIDGKLQRKDA